MAIKYYNVRSKEVVVAETEPQIAALWGSSDRSPNAMGGQDFGWRLAPEVVVEMKKIKGDFSKIQEIAARYQILPQDVGESAILNYISDYTTPSEAAIADDDDYTDEYEAEIRKLERAEKAKATKKETK